VAEGLKKNVNPKLPVVLISPLDWGMGHTTRCISIIKALTNLSCSVLVACNSAQQEILSKEFPDLPIVPLKGYNISYRKGKFGTLIKIIRQIPKILMSIKEERYFLEEFMAVNEVDIIISDNRYGLFHPKAYSVIMTHQLGLRSGLGKWADRQAQRQLYRFISLFDLCLVPDQQEPDSLAGELSNPAAFPAKPVKYIGPLTRFGTGRKQVDELTQQGIVTSGKEIRKVLAILSGPEPQRTILETKILRQAKKLDHQFTIIRGLGSENSNKKKSIEELLSDQKSGTTIMDYADSKQLEKLIDDNDLVICRSGYTSVMDLLVKGKKTIMIPTPGQGEQEYLAKRLSEKGYIIAGRQKNLNLGKLLLQAQQHSFKEFPFEKNQVTYSEPHNLNPSSAGQDLSMSGGSHLLEQTLKEIIEAGAAKKSGLTFAPQTT
jgi:spore coat polysaccharide biosynthesis predicted glycosyltransferase SpsG